MKSVKFMCVILCTVIIALASVPAMASEVYGSNILLNGSFESGTAEWTNWEGNCATAAETFHSGTKSVKLWANTSGQNEQFLQNIKVKPGATYKFEAWVRVPSGQSMQVSLLLSAPGFQQTKLGNMWANYTDAEKDPNFTPNKVNADAGDGHTIWKKLEKTIVVPNEDNFAEYDKNDLSTYPTLCIYFQYTSGGNWNRYLYIDDVSLSRLYTWENTVNSISIMQNGNDVAETGYTAGVVLINFNIDADAKVNGVYPEAVVAVYDGDELLLLNCETVTTGVNSDGTVNIVVGANISTDMLGSNCKLSTFLWTNLDDMISLSGTYTVNAR